VKQSDSIKELATALSAFQGEIHDVEKDAKGNFSRYATLSAVLAVARPALARHGLSVAQFPNSVDGTPGLMTMLMHSSGEYILVDASLLIEKPTMQGLGSALSYQRRYSLSAVLGITQVDDDGHAANVPVREETAPAAPPRPAVKAALPTPSPAAAIAPPPALAPEGSYPSDSLIAMARKLKVRRADLENLIAARYEHVESHKDLSHAQVKTLLSDLVKAFPEAAPTPSSNTTGVASGISSGK